MKLYMVLKQFDDGDAEGVVFTNRKDAMFAATGRMSGAMCGVSTVADNWRDYYGDDGEQYEVKEIEV